MFFNGEIMKAKEYYKEYLNDESDELLRLSKIAHGMLCEITGLIATRNPQRTSAFISIFKEQNSKWKAFVRRIDDCRLVNPDSFLVDYIKEADVRLYDSWKMIGAF